jgi:hypothetical protein
VCLSKYGSSPENALLFGEYDRARSETSAKADCVRQQRRHGPGTSAWQQREHLSVTLARLEWQCWRINCACARPVPETDARASHTHGRVHRHTHPLTRALSLTFARKNTNSNPRACPHIRAHTHSHTHTHTHTHTLTHSLTHTHTHTHTHLHLSNAREELRVGKSESARHTVNGAAHWPPHNNLVAPSLRDAACRVGAAQDADKGLPKAPANPHWDASNAPTCHVWTGRPLCLPNQE